MQCIDRSRECIAIIFFQKLSFLLHSFLLSRPAGSVLFVAIVLLIGTATVFLFEAKSIAIAIVLFLSVMQCAASIITEVSVECLVSAGLTACVCKDKVEEYALTVGNLQNAFMQTVNVNRECHVPAAFERIEPERLYHSMP